MVRMHVYDTAGQERFRTITALYYRYSHGIAVVYDISDRTSFEHVRGWIEEVGKYAIPGTVAFLVGNKCDLTSKRVISREEGQELADELGVRFMETSARKSHNIHHVFDLICSDILEKHAPEPTTTPGSIRLVNSVRSSRPACC